MLPFTDPFGLEKVKFEGENAAALRAMFENFKRVLDQQVRAGVSGALLIRGMVNYMETTSDHTYVISSAEGLRSGGDTSVDGLSVRIDFHSIARNPTFAPMHPDVVRTPGTVLAHELGHAFANSTGRRILTEDYALSFENVYRLRFGYKIRDWH